jgi:membrane associated rhomboid family serine protease
MNTAVKYRILSFLAFFIIFLIIWSVIGFAFENLYGAYKAGISGALTAILAPKIHSQKTQSRKLFQLKWIFLKKPITFRS